MKTGIKSFLAIALFAALAAHGEGVHGGNGSLWHPRGTDGKPLKLRLSPTHPFQDKLVQMIAAADLPRSLKQEILVDLERTSVIFTNETVLYKDLTTQYSLQLQSQKETTTTDHHGRTKTTVEKTWVQSATTPAAYGFCAYPINMKVGDLDNTPVAAFTLNDPKQVFYFSQYIDQMTQDEAMKTVLHEQGHRLAHLGKRAQDERFVEAFAEGLLSYLKKETSKADFYRLLAQNGVPTFEVAGFKDEVLIDSAQQIFKGRLPMILDKTSIDRSDTLAEGYWIQIPKASFNGNPELQTSEAQDAYLSLREPDNSLEPKLPNDEFTEIGNFTDLLLSKVRDKVSAIRSGTTIFPVEFTLEYKKTVEPDSNGVRSQKYGFRKMSINHSSLARSLENQILVRLGDLNPFESARVTPASAELTYWDPRMLELFQSTVERLSLVLEKIKLTDIDHFSALKGELAGSRLNVGFGNKAKVFLPTQYDHWGRKTAYGSMSVTIDPVTQRIPSEEELARALEIQPERIKFYRDRREAERAKAESDALRKKTLELYGFETTFSGTYPNQSDAIFEFLKNQSAFVSRMRCYKDEILKQIPAFENVTLNISIDNKLSSVSKESVEWNYVIGENLGSNEERPAKSASLALFIPKLFLTDPSLGKRWDSVIAEEVFHPENIQENSERGRNFDKGPLIFGSFEYDRKTFELKRFRPPYLAMNKKGPEGHIRNYYRPNTGWPGIDGNATIAYKLRGVLQACEAKAPAKSRKK